MEQELNEMLERIDFSDEFDSGNYTGLCAVNDGKEDPKRRKVI